MTKRVVIDARKQDDFGIGTYIRVLLEGLDRLRLSDLEFETLHRGPRPPSHFASHVFNAADYSLKEFAGLGFAARRAGADILHVPHFTLPFAAPPTVLTVHDLIHLRFPRFFGGAKIGVLKFHLRRAFRKARAIIAVSQSTKTAILNFMPEVEAKLTVIHEAALPVYYENREFPIQDYFLFIGNDKPHLREDARESWHVLQRNGGDALGPGVLGLEEIAGAPGGVGNTDIENTIRCLWLDDLKEAPHSPFA